MQLDDGSIPGTSTLFASSCASTLERRPRRCVAGAARSARLGLKFGISEPVAHLEVSTARKAGKTSSKSSKCGTASRQHAYDRIGRSHFLRGTSADHLGVLVGAIVPLPKLEGSEMLLVYEQGVKPRALAGKFFPPF